ncbi:MAG: hypothetical protein GF331_25985 [Chitinivibrionales bacterium]|nr:hypothetical protein [Chitinivibrionales bacterium]
MGTEMTGRESRRNRRGQYLEERTVEFKDDPFEHEFESRTIASYVTFTLALKAGRRFDRQWVNATFGASPGAFSRALLVKERSLGYSLRGGCSRLFAVRVPLDCGKGAVQPSSEP